MVTDDPGTFRFLIDENVRLSVTRFIQSAGYRATLSRERLESGVPDEDIVDVARGEQWVIVSHDRDFRRLLAPAPFLTRRVLRESPLLHLAITCEHSLDRVRQCWPLVEHHLRYARDAEQDVSRIVLLEREVEVRYRLEPDAALPETSAPDPA
jgi:hypothetical protein